VDGVELGAEFVHGRPRATLALLREAGLKVVPATGQRWVGTDGLLAPAEHRFASLDQLIDAAGQLEHDVPAAEFFGQFREDPHLGESARWARRLVEGFDAADPGRASLKALIEEWSSDAGMGSAQGRPQHGYGALVAHLVERLPASVDLRLQHRVTGIDWSGSPVLVAAEADGVPLSIECRAAVVTLPLGVLQARPGEPGAVRFVPELREKHDALEGLVMGSVLKAALRFKDPFWTRLDGGKYRKAGFFFRMSGHFPTFWSELPEKGTTLNAWYGGPGAALLSLEPPGVIIAEAVESLQTIFGAGVSIRDELDKARVYNWQDDPFSRGAYSYIAAGARGARSALAQPLGSKLFFAGEAADDQGEGSTVAGALASGERAASEVASALA
jgi:monoamine oxidase